MARNPRIDIEIAGIKGVIRALGEPENELLQEPWREMMGRVGELAERQAAADSPVGTGRTRTSIRSRIPRSALPKSVRVAAAARNRRYPYPRWLEFSPSSPHRGWMRGAVRATIPRASREVTLFAGRVGRNWEGLSTE